MLCCDEHLWEPGQEIIQGVRIHHVFPLDEMRKPALVAFKDHGVTALAKVFGVAVSKMLERVGIQKSVIAVIPPVNSSNFRKRGYHPTRLIATRLGLRVITARANKKMLDQRKLSATQREENLEGAFSFPSLIGTQVLVLDDVLTTGATIRELIRAAEQAGAEIVAGCVLARRFPDFDSVRDK